VATPDVQELDVQELDALSDDELAALALAADPEPTLGDDAVSFWDMPESGRDRWLPEWYMPAPMRGAPLLSGWRRRVVILVIVSFLAINAYGLCNTYGQLSFG
jgi:hypothetical protein